MRTLRRLLAASAVAAYLGHPPIAQARQKTDAVVLRNGDRITCEVKRLASGLLTISTDDMGTIKIEWDKIRSVVSSTLFEVQTTSGFLVYGTLAAAPSGQIAIVSTTQTNLNLFDVFRISPIEKGFWHHLEGSINGGGSYTQASAIGQVYASFQVKSRRPSYEWAISYDSTTTFEENEENTGRYVARAVVTRLLPDRWLLLGFTQAERNSDLGINLRATGGGGGGRNLLQSLRTVLQVIGGLSVNHEVPVDGEPDTNLDVFGTLRYTAVTYDYPKSESTLTITVLPSATEPGRVRANASAKLSRALFTNDFNFAITAFDDYDSRPPTESARTNDFGVTFSVGWVF